MNSIHVNHKKQGGETESVYLPVPEEVIIPLSQHIGAPLEPTVNVGDEVVKGQVIGNSEGFVSVPIHSPVSGTVKEIFDFVMPMGNRTRAVKITVSENEKSVKVDNKIEDKKSFLEFVRNIGLLGLGGAAFPTHVKLAPQKDVDALVINAAECEPHITADQREISENIEGIKTGIALIQKYVGVDNVYIGIENNKPNEIDSLKQVFKGNESVHVVPLKPTYPQGAEKVLIYNVLHRVVPEGGLPMDVGVIVMNISSVGFLGKAYMTGEPLTHKRITIAGDCLKESKNVIVPVGTKISDIVKFFGGYIKEPREIVMGGPMMGTTVYGDDFPVLKSTNAILFMSDDLYGIRKESACIRCGKCISACPFGLSPVKLYEAAEDKDKEMLAKEHIMLCMECGSCSYVCPAGRHLTQSHRLAKALMKERKN